MAKARRGAVTLPSLSLLEDVEVEEIRMTTARKSARR